MFNKLVKIFYVEKLIKNRFIKKLITNLYNYLKMKINQSTFLYP